jgi:hypothetical protein
MHERAGAHASVELSTAFSKVRFRIKRHVARLCAGHAVDIGPYVTARVTAVVGDDVVAGRFETPARLRTLRALIWVPLAHQLKNGRRHSQMAIRQKPDGWNCKEFPRGGMRAGLDAP